MTATEKVLRTITPGEFDKASADSGGGTLVDVRTPAEFQQIHAPEALNIPLDQLDAQGFAAERGDNGPVFVICRSGNRSKTAAEKLVAAGVDAVSVEGGMPAWEQAGLSVVRGKATVSLERQVRIAAGAIVLAGTAMSWLAGPAWMIIPGFIGAGLLYSGLTDTCGMAMVLARMPWNRV